MTSISFIAVGESGPMRGRIAHLLVLVNSDDLLFVRTRAKGHLLELGWNAVEDFDSADIRTVRAAQDLTEQLRSGYEKARRNGVWCEVVYDAE
jgi:hypothetical protein